MKVRKIEPLKSINPYTRAKVINMGNIMEIVTMQKQSYGCSCRKIDKDHYVDLNTGELLDYKHIDSRADSTRSIRNTLANIRALINTNVTELENVRWITLTYAENMTDTKRLYADYVKFWKRFCYWCKGEGYSKPEYITVQEPQGRGAWHIHGFFIWYEKAPYIPNLVMSKLWQQGFVSVKRMQSCDNVGAYFSAYLGDMPLEDVEKLPDSERQKAIAGAEVQDKQFTDDDGTQRSKKFVKGSRLCLYPPGMNIIRKSKGIRQPEVEYMPYFEAEKKACSAKQTFSQTFEILDDDGNAVNVISRAYYNSKTK